MDTGTAVNKIYMKGFKSFQRQTAVPFYPGLTAIVGQNGSGKSNIIDALSFVLGERSSNLRAEKLEQLIYNGGEDGTPSDEAIVRLTLDNASGVFDEFLEDGHEDEITIGRKINRNGYSTYRFQGSNCKRSLIDDLLGTADIDPDGYHFVRQGKITDITTQTPVENRRIIDDISGIAAYEDKKEQAEEELAEVEDRLTELKMKEELKKEHVEELRQQKEQAEQYKELQERKERIEYTILVRRQEALQKQLEELGASEQEERIEELGEAIEELDEEMEALEDRKDEIDEEIQSGQDTSVIEEIERIKGKIERKKDKIENKRDKISDIEELLASYEQMSQYSGRNRAVKKVLGQDFDGVHGTVSQLLHYNPRFSVAIETALGGRMDNIVVDDRQTARKCVDYLKRKGIGRATFLPLDSVKVYSKSSSAKRAVKKPGIVDFAIDLVDYDAQYENAMKHVLSDTIVAQDLESLERISGVKAVTLDGDIQRKGGSITGGKKKRSKNKGGSRSKSGLNPEEKKEQKEQLQSEIEELKQEIGTLNGMLEDKKQESEEQSQVSEELKEEKADITDELKELRTERREKAEERNTLQSRVGKAQKQRARFDAELDTIAEDLKDHEDRDEDDLLDQDNVDTLKKERTRTITKINDLGTINARAIDKYDEVREEYEEFRDRLKTVHQEKREIEQIIEDIEEQKREQFMETMNSIEETFNELFQELFEGGDATLELEEEDDIDSGLLIKARPPDKDPVILESLSGGEKTLTAIAFVFGIQEYQPSPFYVMDEIDAALDDTNARQLSELLKDYADASQLIFISHNEETVRHADRAYGISMRDGVSKIRSIEL